MLRCAWGIIAAPNQSAVPISATARARPF
jgi:hypothetical protein